MRRTIVVVLIAVVVAAGGAVFLWATRDQTAAPAATRPLPTAPVTRGDLTTSVRQSGELGYAGSYQLVAQLSGTVTAVPAPGQVVDRGQRLLAVEARPVVLFFGDVPLYRPLSAGATGADVLLLEQNLAALGYGGFTVDSTFSSGTAAAVKRWQKALDLPETGVVNAGAAVVAPAAVRIESVAPVIGEVLSPGTVVATATGTGHGVRVELDRRYRALAVVGGAVRVSLFGGTAVDGQVTAVGTTATAASDTGQQQQPTATQQQTIGVDITVTSPESALGGVFEGPVTVEFPGEARHDVLSVPIEALTLDADGGYAVVVVVAGRRRTVPVTTGLITSNRVEVAGVAEGMRVEVPDL
ncbi:peptidoglycan-binding domain-containing protein [Actinophytocola sp.]|uniref:peptidoglycan-binding domain-containing protein n=1 Tax=Actinophytocola sp. TaxID=1872138 RepID=UPI00389A9933